LTASNDANASVDLFCEGTGLQEKEEEEKEEEEVASEDDEECFVV